MRTTVAVCFSIALLAAQACSGDTIAESQAATTDDHAIAHRVHRFIDFHGPESAKYDPELDVYLVSNMLGFGSVKDGNGYITRVPADDPSRDTQLVQGGRNGVTLHAPKGMAIHGDTLWVADIDALRAFDRRNGAPLATIELGGRGAVLLNDVVVGPDDRLYVTDTGIDMSPKGVIYRGGDKIFAIGPGRAVEVIAEGPQLHRPNGIAWDARGKVFLLVSFDPFRSHVWSFAPGDTTRTNVATGNGKFDGVEVLPDGRILYSSWTDSSVHIVDGTSNVRALVSAPGAADLGVDTKRNRVLVPVSMADRVDVWQLGPRVVPR